MKKISLKNLRLQTKLMLLVSVVVLISLIATAYLIGSQAVAQSKRYQEEKVMDIALTLSHSQVIQDGLTGKASPEMIQQYVKQVRESTNTQYIVVLNKERIRLSHPNADRIGGTFVGGDENRAFEGESYTSLANGTLGEALRAFVPIYVEEKLVGAVVVGILAENLRAVVADSLYTSYMGIGFGLLIGSIAAFFLARQVKQTLYGLEPNEIAKLLYERDAVLQSVQEGIIAIDDKGIINIVNESARQLFNKAGIMGEPIGQSVERYLPSLQLKETLKTHQMKLNQEEKLNGLDVVINRMPIQGENRTVGALATIQDKTEVLFLIEQLSIVKTFAETLRIQTHEFMNKLHVIGAMVHTKSYEELKEYTTYLSDFYQKEVGTVSKYIHDPIISGFLINHLSKTHELGIHVEVNGDVPLPKLRKIDQMDKMMTIIGNLVENAVEAVRHQEDPYIEMNIDYKDSSFLFAITDNGPGFPNDNFVEYYTIGASTKGENRGYGLYMIQKAIDELNGKMEVFTETSGTTFSVKIPYEGERDD